MKKTFASPYAPHVAWQQVGGEVVVIDLTAGTALGLNPTASIIWASLEDHDLESITGQVASRFDIAPDVARRDVEEFISSMRQRGLLQ